MIIYQVLPRLWGNGRFSDWQTPAFDYLKTLGADAVWYTGIPRHSSGKSFVKGNAGSPYSITDYYDVNPYLADDPSNRMKEFSLLVQRTHEAGLKVITDLVPNHVAPDCNQVPTCSYYDFDWDDTRKIDYSDRRAWDAMLEIALFWAGLGVDGFRCDMVEMVPAEFLRFLTGRVREKYPDFLFIGEVYEKNGYRLFVKELGFDLLYDKSGYYDLCRNIICNNWSARNLTSNWQRLGDLQGSMLNFLENHDEQRIASPFFAGKAEKAYAAAAFGALFNDASFMLYAGQELGEDASEGAQGRTSIFDFARVKSLQDLSKRLSGGHLPYARNHVLTRYQFILRHAVMFRGMSNWDLAYCQGGEGGFDPDRHAAFLRFNRRTVYLVFCNFSAYPCTVTLSIPEEFAHLCRTTAEVSARAWDTAVVRIRK